MINEIIMGLLVLVLLVVLIKLILERRDQRRHFWIFLVAFLFAACGSKKEITTNSNQNATRDSVAIAVYKDLIQKGQVITRTLPVYSQIVIEKPCDEQGNFKPINQTVGSGQNKISITTRDGQLIIDQYIDSTVASVEKEYREKFIKDSINLRKELLKEYSKEKIVVKTVWPWWLWIAVIGGVLFLALWVYQKFFLPIKLI